MAGPRLLKLIGIVLVFFSAGKEEKNSPTCRENCHPFLTTRLLELWTEFLNGKRQGRGLSGVYSILILFAPNTN